MELDAEDTAFLNSLVPDGCMPTGLLAVVTWLDQDAEPHIRVYNQTDERITGILGLLELAKKHFLDDTPPWKDG
jgi:hypothetical protein